MTQGLDFCAFESRPSDFVALKLLALSLERHAPTSRVHVFTAPLPDAMAAWLAARPNVVCHAEPEPQGTGWDIKAELLLWLLDNGVERAVWIDSDIILANALPSRLVEASAETLVIAEEPKLVQPRGISNRAIDLGLEPRADGANFEINSSVVSVSRHHRALLEDWQRVVLSPAYNAGKDFGHFVRPLAFQSDQSVLSALLGSRRFQQIPIALLRESREIAQCLRKTGYRPGPRALNALRGTPAFVHAIYVPKPWHEVDATFVWESLSPYRLVALPYADHLDPEESAWLWREPPKARTLRRLFRGHPDLCGLPLALREKFLRPREEILTVPEVTSGELMKRHGVPLP
ncbi:MAG: hypothetical protein AAGG09_01635 [Pseudomonadota bacterium]